MRQTFTRSISRTKDRQHQSVSSRPRQCLWHALVSLPCRLCTQFDVADCQNRGSAKWFSTWKQGIPKPILYSDRSYQTNSPLVPSVQYHSACPRLRRVLLLLLIASRPSQRSNSPANVSIQSHGGTSKTPHRPPPRRDGGGGGAPPLRRRLASPSRVVVCARRRPPIIALLAQPQNASDDVALRDQRYNIVSIAFVRRERAGPNRSGDGAADRPR